jgi:hypothetical protein
VDNDPCAPKVGWSTISAASTDSTFAGLLAGLLIAAAAALLVQWYQGGAPPTIALFGSGVPVLTLSTYLFTVIGAVHYPPDTDYKSNLCSQLWSEWLLATSSLFIGSAVLVCGLGWALVNYADNLAVNLCQANIPIATVERSRRFFIRLNAWLSASITTAATALLIVTSVLYLQAIGYQNLSRELFGVKWYLVFFVYLFGVSFIGRESYVIFSRTSSARRANKKSCAAYAAGSPPVAADNGRIEADVSPVRPPGTKVPGFELRNTLAMRCAREFVVVILVALGALLAVYLTSEAVEDRHWGTVSPDVVIYVVVLYVIVRSSYVVIARIVELVSPKTDDTPTDNEAIPPADPKSVERIRIRYDFGRLTATTYSVVFLAVLVTFFVVALTQGPLWPAPRIILSLLLGGLYPAVVLTGLSSSVPAAEDVKRPKWETVRWLAYIP